MNIRKPLSIVLMLLLAALVFAGPVSAASPYSKTTPFDFTDYIFVASMFDPGIVQDTGGGSLTRDMVIVWDLQASDTRATGRLTINGVMAMCKTAHPAPCWGPGHGTWVMDVNNDGSIEWQGVVHIMPQSNNDELYTKYTGEGVGDYKGLKITFGNQGDPISMSGEIFDPKAK